MSTTVYYDGTWQGLLTAIFEDYEYRLQSCIIVKSGTAVTQSLFGRTHQVYTDKKKALRVKNGLLKNVGKTALQELYCAFLSEKEGIEVLILRVVQYYMAGEKSVHSNYAHEDVLQIKQIHKSVMRERHRFKAFVRFRESTDGIFLALIEPDFNVLPLISTHFKDRYADQLWIIYDVKRQYGLHYDKSTVREIVFDKSIDVKQLEAVCSTEEQLYDRLWKRYFQSTNIVERKNTKLHVQHVPKRYWKYLNEKGE